MRDSNTPAPHNTVPLTVPDPHGQAALLLVESLMHGLCEKQALSADEAIAIAERAADVQAAKAEEADGASVPLWQSHGLLIEILASLRTDTGTGAGSL